MPTRYLKPEIRDSETLDSLSPLAEVLFYRLLVSVDDFGRIDARPSYIKSVCFPVRDSFTAKDAEKYLMELNEKGVISLYVVNSRRYLQMSKWANIPRSKESKCPQIADDCIQVYANVLPLHTNLPVTVTVTETETVSEKSLTLPDWLPKSLLKDFKAHRVKLKKPMTDHAVSLLIGELEKLKLDGFDPVECLNTAMVSGWLKPYAPKEGGKSAKNAEFNLQEWMKTK